MPPSKNPSLEAHDRGRGRMSHDPPAWIQARIPELVRQSGFLTLPLERDYILQLQSGIIRGAYDPCSIFSTCAVLGRCPSSTLETNAISSTTDCLNSEAWSTHTSLWILLQR